MIEKVIIRSNTLHCDVALKIVTPSQTRAEKVMLLLHGSIQPEGDFSLIESMPQELCLQELCDRYQLIAVTPYMKNCYYISSDQYNCNLFVSEELPEWIKERYCLPEHTEFILAGISMGGYGAVLISAHTDRFHKIISISGAFITDDIELGNPEIWGGLLPNDVSIRNSFLFYFLPLEELHESTEKNVFAALNLLEGRDAEMLITCGTDDRMFSRNKLFVDKLEKHKIRYDRMWIKGGVHDSACFREGLWWAAEKTF